MPFLHNAWYGAAIRARRVMDQLIADEIDTPHLKQA